MNIEHKKTALDDDSFLYQQRDDSFGKKDTSKLSKQQKFQYFKDYYLVKIIVAVLIVAFVGAIINGTVFNRSTNVMSVVLLNESQIADDAGLEAALTEYLQIENKNDYVSISNYNLQDYQVNMAYVTQLSGKGIDLVICSESYFETGSNQGIFTDLSEFLPEDMYAALSDRIVEGCTAETDDYGEIISYNEPAPYGIDLSGTSRFTEFGGVEEHPILCVVANVSNTENALKTISYFTE
ncbi:MAG: hypothetical protein Q4E89_10045 [Eubacteriales bacterium]|nr:hypothetical protein [Eubacteriales bacterium]